MATPSKVLVPEVRIQQLAEVIITAAERDANDFYLKRNAIEKIRKVLLEAGRGDLILTVSLR